MSMHFFLSAADTAASAAIKATPPSAIVAAPYFGVNVPLTVQIITGVYVAAQLFFLLRDKWWRERNKE